VGLPANVSDNAMVDAAMSPDRSTTLLDLMVLVVENWRKLIVVPMLAGMIALGISYALTPVYTATARILPPQQQSGMSAIVASQLGALAGFAGGTAGLKNPSDQYVAMMRSRTVADRLIEKFGLFAVYQATLPEDARLVLARNSSVAAGKDGLIVIDVDDPEPARAAAIANGYVAELRNMLRNLAIEESSQRRSFFESRLADARDKLVRSEQLLRSSSVSLTVLKADPRAAVEAVARMRAAITVTELRIASMRGFLSESSPDLKQAKQELEALKSQLSQAVRGDGAEAGESGEYIGRYRTFKYHETLYELLAKQYELARLDEAREGSLVQVVDEAVAPQRRSFPRRSLIATVTALTTGALMLGALFLIDAVRRLAADPAEAPKLARIAAAIGRAPRSRP